MRLAATLTAAGAAIAVVVVLLAGSHGHVNVGALDPVAQAADTTAAAGSAEFGIAGSITAGQGQTIPINGSGALDMRNQHMRMSISFPIPGIGSSQVDELFDGNAFYIHFPTALAARIPGGKTWMKMDLSAMSKAAGVNLKQAMQANQQNPADMLQALKGVGTSRKVGTEDIDGAFTTHYAATIDLNKVAQQIADKQTVDSLKHLFAQSGVTSFPIDVWVDRAGRVRRESETISGSQFSMDMTVSFTRFGVPVDTTPPPADQVMDASALLGAANG